MKLIDIVLPFLSKLTGRLRGGSLKNIMTLMSGTMLSTVIPILVSPVMTRIFSPADYGILGIYVSISGVLGVLAYAHYAQAVLLAKTDDEARIAVKLTLKISILFSCLMMAVVVFVMAFSRFDFLKDIKHWVYLIPLSIVLNGINATLLVWANRTKSYALMARNRIWQAIATVAIQLLCGFLIEGEAGLLLGLLTGQLTGVLLLLGKFTDMFKFWGAAAGGQYEVFKNYKNLVLYSTPSEFLNSVINQTPVFLLQKFGGTSFVGSYNFTNRLLGMPQLVVSSAIVEVFKQRASEDFRMKGNCRAVFIKTFKSLLLISILPFLALIFLSPFLFSFIFGPEWREAGVFAQYLSVLFLFRFSISPLTYVYYIAGKQREDFFLHLLFLFITTASFFLGNYLFKDKRLLILCYSVSYSLVYIIYLIRSYHFSKGVINKEE